MAYFIQNSALPSPEPDTGAWPMSTPDGSSIPEFSPDKPWPKISIVTPSYNQGEYLEKTIRSVLLQGYPNLEYVIIDGGSTDNSVDIIRKYESWLSYWESAPDRGQSHAINKGFERTTGELLGWLNSDDWYTEGALFKVAEEYMKDRSVGAIFGQGHIVDPSGRIVLETRAPEVTEENLFGWFAGGAEFMQPSCLFTREAWLDRGPLAEDLHYAMDLDLWIRIARKFKFRKIDELLSLSLRHESAKTRALAEQSYIDVAIVYMRHGREDKARDVLEKRLARLLEYKREHQLVGRIPLLRRILNAIGKVLN